ncbi:predicted protein [Scheffersomyces stipitis CBS 6054]|uniref:Uncharacterized protein n=1 Tax=Scheffersomyces stipitis (strain ATCC 58785 / CBS 6054 / NBRC 10063 / NRRL Y-11545) TaxID=322104 RepID=A3LWG8_PICST|nr:predicted protein [Scheffersomyces stipitis CBS 6054]ABN67275.1 predicted protein [Scheffersomyces stipitis CBS 6054]
MAAPKSPKLEKYIRRTGINPYDIEQEIRFPYYIHFINEEKSVIKYDFGTVQTRLDMIITERTGIYSKSGDDYIIKDIHGNVKLVFNKHYAGEIGLAEVIEDYRMKAIEAGINTDMVPNSRYLTKEISNRDIEKYKKKYRRYLDKKFNILLE